MAKRKFSKAQLAAQKLFAKRARAGAFQNPKKKRRGKRRNPESVVMEVPVRKKKKLVRPSKKDIDYNWLKKEMLKKATSEERARYDSMSPSERDFMVGQAAKRLFKKTVSEAEKAVKKEAALRARRAKSLHEQRELVDRGGEIIMVKETNPKKRRKRKGRKAKRKHAKRHMANPRKRRKKNCKHKRNPNADWGMVTAGNPRRKRRKARKARKHRRKHARLSTVEVANPRKKRRKNKKYYLVGRARLSRKGKRRMSKRKNFILAVNPSAQQLISTYGVAVVGGLAYPWFNYGVQKAIAWIDTNVTKGMFGQATAQIDSNVPGAAAPVVSLLAVIGVKALLGKFDTQVKEVVGDQALKYIHGAIDTIGVVSAAGLGQAIITKAKMTPTGMGMSGVKYFPAPMSGADFGYPQMGDGYVQSPSDFGNVRFFPGDMKGVEYFPPGSRGDDMFRASEATQMSEAEGLGIIPEGLGIIPEGLGSADFGIIPEGLGEQMG